VTVSECEFFSDDCVGVVLQKWHPDKFKEEDSATSRFQEINEAYQVLSDPIARQEYDKKRMRRIYEHNTELLNEYKELILTCNGLGVKHYLW
jgi:DnaJ-class molecular chaperone